VEQYRWAFVQTRDAELLVKIAECHERLGESEQAISFYSKFIASAPPEKRRQEVERLIDMLRLGGTEAGVAAAAPGPEFAQIAYKSGEEAYRQGKFAFAAERFEEAYRIAKFPTILYDLAQAYRRLYETEHNVDHLKKAIEAYRVFLMQAPHAKQHAVAQKFLAMLDVELVESQSYGARGVRERATDAPRVGPLATSPQAGAPQVAPVAATSVAKPLAQKQPVYKKWWLWTIVGVGAAAVAVGAGVGVYMASQAIPDHRPVTWTLLSP